MNMDGSSEHENEIEGGEQRIVAQQPQHMIDLPTATGKIAIDLDSFTGDVVNAVNDVTLTGFDNLEQFILQSLGSKHVESPRAINQVVDNIFSKLQDDVDVTFGEWESAFRQRIVKVAAEQQDMRRRSQSDINKDSGGFTANDGEEQALDAELDSLRREIVTANRERTKMRREIASLRMQLALKQDVVNSIEAMDATLDSANLEEVARSASDLIYAIGEAGKCQNTSQRSGRSPLTENSEPDLETDAKPLPGQSFESLTLDKYISGRSDDLHNLFE